MAQDRIIKDGSDVKKLAQKLGRCPTVARFDEEPGGSAASLAYCLDSLEGQFREFLDIQLPKLSQSDLSDQEVCDLLYGIGATFGQILWHIGLPKFYGYLQEEKKPSPTDAPPLPPKHR